MPYNTSAIPPRVEATGTTQLPLTRVRKMIMQDQDIAVCANSSAFVITLATEMFIQYMAEQGLNVVKSEKKPRRNIQYKDLSSAVHKNDNLEFLVDIVPRTVPFKEIKAKKASAPPPVNSAANGVGSGTVEAGQTTLDGQQLPVMNGTNGYAAHAGSANSAGSVDDNDNDPNTQLEMESKNARLSAESAESGVQESQEDVEMS